jgi:hypothetical protein
MGAGRESVAQDQSLAGRDGEALSEHGVERDERVAHRQQAVRPVAKSLALPPPVAGLPVDDDVAAVRRAAVHPGRVPILALTSEIRGAVMQLSASQTGSRDPRPDASITRSATTVSSASVSIGQGFPRDPSRRSCIQPARIAELYAGEIEHPVTGHLLE